MLGCLSDEKERVVKFGFALGEKMFRLATLVRMELSHGDGPSSFGNRVVGEVGDAVGFREARELGSFVQGIGTSVLAD